MAKPTAPKGGTSRIRFIMLDAEITDGDLTQITDAIQNALKPTVTTIVHQTVASRPQQSISKATEETQDIDIEELDLEPNESALAPDSKPSAPRSPSKPRKPSTPKVVEIDLNTGVSLEYFARTKKPKSEPDRNLVILAWFHEHRENEPVTVNHVYTCYRALKWPSGIEDFSWPLRALKKKQLIGSLGRGEYTINHLGIAAVEEMEAAD